MSRRDEQPSGERDTERFRAQVEAMRAQGAKWQELGTQGLQAADYASTWVDFDPSGGAAMERFVDVTTGMDTGVRDLMKDIYRAVHGSGAAIIASADRYAELDAAAAARLDRDYWTH
jgi:hypothetical protein